MTFDPIPPIPTVRSSGRIGDFDFLNGVWRIENRRLNAETGDWDVFPGEAMCWTILGGAGSIEDLRIPARNFAGMAIRLLDRTQQLWTDTFINAKSGVLPAPGPPGSFENGVAIFPERYEDKGQAKMSVGVWDQITLTSCRWRQATSADEGQTWAHNWIMEWRRIS